MHHYFSGKVSSSPRTHAHREPPLTLDHSKWVRTWLVAAEEREGLWVPVWAPCTPPLQSQRPVPPGVGETQMGVQPEAGRLHGKTKGPDFQDLPSSYFSVCGFCAFSSVRKGVSLSVSFFPSYLTFLCYFEQGSNSPAIFACFYT